MVIIIMGEVGSGRDSVGARLAESLGWEFLNFDKRCGEEGTSGSMHDAKGSSTVELLWAALDASTYEWRDTVLSCPILTEGDQKHLRENRSLVKFVHLEGDDSRIPSSPTAEAGSSDPAIATGLKSTNDSGVLILERSMGMERILNSVLTEAVLQRSCNNASSAWKVS